MPDAVVVHETPLADSLMLTVDRYVIRQVALPMLGGLGLLLLLFTAYNAANLLRDTVSGELPAEQLLVFLGIRDLIALEVLLPTAFYFSVVVTVAASHRDREAFALYAAGISPHRSTRALWIFTIVVAIAVALLANFARPWSYRTSYELTAATSELSVETMQPGRYYRWRDTFVIAAQEVRPDSGILEGVFVQNRSGGTVNVIRSRTGRIRDDGEHLPLWFLFEDGTSYQIDPAGKLDRTSDFRRLFYRASHLEERSPATKRRARPTRYLSASTAPKEVAEFQWRIVVPALSFLLGLIGIQLGRTAPGRTPYVRFIIAIVVYAVVFNLAQIVRIAVENQQISTLPGVYTVPFGIALVCLAMLFIAAVSRGRTPAARTPTPSSARSQ